MPVPYCHNCLNNYFLVVIVEMSSGTSDLLPTLSTTTPLASGLFFLTDKLIAGQYSSVTIIVYSDTQTNVFIEFSGDGVNFDVRQLKTFNALQGGSASNVILSKWMRLRIENTSGASQTVLRVQTYANIQNTSISASLLPINNIAPSVNIDNLPLTDNVMLVESPVTVASADCSAFEQILNMQFLTPRVGQHYNFGGSQFRVFGDYNTGDISVALTNENDMSVRRVGVSPGNEYACIKSARITNPRNKGKTICTMAAKWPLQNFADGIRHRALVGLIGGVGRVFGDISAFTLSSPMASIGIFSNDVGVALTELEIVYNSGLGDPSVDPSNIDPVISYPQSLWNVDKADGNQNLPPLDATSINGFRITIDHSGRGSITFQVQHPVTNKYVTVHRVVNGAQRGDGSAYVVSPLFRYNALSSMMYISNKYPAISPNVFKEMRVSILDVQQTATGLVNLPMSVSTVDVNYDVGDATAVRYFLAIRCLDVAEIWPPGPPGAVTRRNSTSGYLASIRLSYHRGQDTPDNPFSEMWIETLEYHDIANPQPGPAWTTSGFAVGADVVGGVNVGFNTPIQWKIDPSIIAPPLYAPRKRIFSTSIAGPDRNSAMTKIFDLAEASSLGTSANIEEFLMSPGKMLYFGLKTESDDISFRLSIDFVTGV
tara:strand:+ start:9300 stop:11267 length:1968 start_codon:yes stop_codon:yes gene_type:complete